MLTPTSAQLDALREVANIGCGHAANALARLVGNRAIHIDVPRVMLMAPSEVVTLVGGGSAPVVGSSLGMRGGLSGQMLLVMPESDAHALCGVLLGQPSSGVLGEAQRGAVSEVANILASACLSAIGNLTGLKLLPTVPSVAQGQAEHVLACAMKAAQASAEIAVVMEARFYSSAPAPAPSLSGELLVLPDLESLKLLLSRLGL